jgi:hypothetical protein
MDLGRLSKQNFGLSFATETKYNQQKFFFFAKNDLHEMNRANFFAKISFRNFMPRQF